MAEKAQGLPQVPVSLVYSGVQSTDTSGADEWDLDTQTSTAVAPKAKRLYVYVATSLTDRVRPAALPRRCHDRGRHRLRGGRCPGPDVYTANGAYTALPGYDYTTGLGSWEVGVLSNKLR